VTGRLSCDPAEHPRFAGLKIDTRPLSEQLIATQPVLAAEMSRQRKLQLLQRGARSWDTERFAGVGCSRGGAQPNLRQQERQSEGDDSDRDG
jgi:hypothetical protein